ncbi:MAG TPA: class I SAM-dependent methyltransferase [Solirubrobacteraceae bacterium]|jgi:SAM-dependent methyltransferase
MARGFLSRLLAPDASSGADQWQRMTLNRAVDSYLVKLGPANLSAVEISGDAHADKGWREYLSTNYPEFDLVAALAGQGPFDVVICEQVIEHVEDPCAAAANLRGLCVAGGHVIVSTPFLIRVHEEWGMQDYWRFTPRGLRTLLERAGLEVDSVGSWGNRRVIAANLDRWPAYRRWHSLRDEPKLPVQVWAFARNPG